MQAGTRHSTYVLLVSTAVVPLPGGEWTVLSVSVVVDVVVSDSSTSSLL